jgi:hypothetical protein
MSPSTRLELVGCIILVVGSDACNANFQSDWCYLYTRTQSDPTYSKVAKCFNYEIGAYLRADPDSW